jgi:hypothetical protein
MTGAEEAELRGEIFGLKILLLNIIGDVARHASDPIAYLDRLQKQSGEGIARTTVGNVKPAHMRAFQNAAAGIVVQAVEATKAVLIPTPPQSELQ